MTLLITVFVIFFLNVGLPSILLYYVWFRVLYNFIAGRVGPLYLLVIIVPLAWWAYALVSKSLEAKRPDPAMKQVVLAKPPSTLPPYLVIADNGSWRVAQELPPPLPLLKVYTTSSCKDHFNNIDRIFQKTDAGWKRIYNKSSNRKQKQKMFTVPKRFLLANGRKCARTKLVNKGSRTGTGGPYELKLEGHGPSRLIGFYYKRFVRVPYPLPILSLRGWLGTQNSSDLEERSIAMARFISTTISSLTAGKNPSTGRKQAAE